MGHSMDDLLVRQVNALVSETTDAVCTDTETIPSMEAHFYGVLARYCAEKQRPPPQHLRAARPLEFKGV